MKDLLKNKWEKLFMKFECNSSQWNYFQITFDILFKNYFFDENRHYHNAMHINNSLELLDEIKEHCYKIIDNEYINWLAIELAIWFHDFIYDTRKNNNEEMSALAAKQFILGLENNILLANEVESLILFTKHDREPVTIEEKIISDIDLHVFADYGYHELIEDGHVDNIRKEYNWVPNFVYYPQRLKIIERFLNKNRIFHTDYFYHDLNCEEVARKNIVKEIELIKKIHK